MPENRRAPHQFAENHGGVSQSKGHLDDKSAEELLTELEVKLDTMTDRTYDADAIDPYLSALDKKQPIQTQFDVKGSWEQFRSQHALLFEEDDTPTPNHPKSASHSFRFRRVIPRIIAAALVIGILGMLFAQATGFDVFGAIGQWTRDTFRFSAPSTVLPDAFEDTHTSAVAEKYSTLQDAFDAHSIDIPLAPSWVPKGYQLDFVEATAYAEQYAFSASYINADNEAVTLNYTYWVGGQFVPSVVEKDAEDVQTYTRNGIAHYILSNENVHLAAWVNGACECYIVGNLEFEEFITMIDSIYV